MRFTAATLLLLGTALAMPLQNQHQPDSLPEATSEDATSNPHLYRRTPMHPTQPNQGPQASKMAQEAAERAAKAYGDLPNEIKGPIRTQKDTATDPMKKWAFGDNEPEPRMQHPAVADAQARAKAAADAEAARQARVRQELDRAKEREAALKASEERRKMMGGGGGSSS